MVDQSFIVKTSSSKDAATQLPEFPPLETIPEVGELDELQTFVGSKKLNLAMDCSESF